MKAMICKKKAFKLTVEDDISSPQLINVVLSGLCCRLGWTDCRIQLRCLKPLAG